MAGVIVHATINERHRLQCFHIWVGVIVHATISERRRLQCFHIWVVVIVHATIVNGIDYSASMFRVINHATVK